MKILAVDQARHGAWSLFDYDKKSLLDYGTFDFDNRNYRFEQAVVKIEALIDELINIHGADAVFFEDIQLRQNPSSFKRLAQLQGVLVNLCEKNEYLYGLISPSQWQEYCKARGRTAKEVKAGTKEAATKSGKKASKMLSIQYVANHFGIQTDNDNLADAICIGVYVIHSIVIRTKNSEQKDGSKNDKQDSER